MKHLQRIIIPNYIEQVVLSNKVRPKFLHITGRKIDVSKLPVMIRKSLGATKDIHDLAELNCIIYGRVKNKVVLAFVPEEKYLAKIDTILTRCELILATSDNQVIILNETKQGKQKVQRINAQDIYSGVLHPVNRSKIVTAIKESFVPYLKDIPILTDYPVLIRLTVFNCPRKASDNSKATDSTKTKWDLGNHSYLYGKCFLDLLCSGTTGTLDRKTKTKIKYFEPKLPDDNIFYVTHDPQGGLYVPTETVEERKLVFDIFHDDRDIVINNSFYKKFHNR
jgi:hypothetical protein